MSTEGTDGRGDFSIVQRVRFGELDAMQHMNNVEFLRFFETARIDWFTHVLPQHRPGGGGSIAFIFAECHIAYRAPAFYNDHIRTWVRPVEMKRSSLRLEFEMRVESDDRLVADGWGALVGYDYDAGKPRQLPDDVRERIEPLLG